MNERIRELAEHAKQFAHDEWNGTLAEFRYSPAWFEFYNKKFAELIVQECADVALWEQGKGYDVGEKIKEHFGVE
jgi:hypothetical protein